MEFTTMFRKHSTESYRAHVRNLMTRHPLDEAMSLAVGGSYEAVGILQESILQKLESSYNATIVDLGCGCGRYATRIASWYRGDYLGLDVVPELIAFADARTPANFKFALTEDYRIPLQNRSVDLVTAFSLFTHLFHEETYCYLKEATRVLRPGGQIVFSFLEFAAPTHWPIFEHWIDQWASGKLPHINMFIERDAIMGWVEHLGLRVKQFLNGWDFAIRLTEPITYDDGTHHSTFAPPGQSLAVLEHRRGSDLT